MADGKGDLILLCYDGSDDAHRAVEFAGSIFAGRNAVVLSVWEPISTQPIPFQLAVMPLIDDAPIREAAERVAVEGTERARDAGLEATAAVVEAPRGVAAAILDVAAQRDASLIVMGTRGFTGIRSLLLGSVSHAVAQQAHRPLVIVPSEPLAAARVQASHPRP